MEFFWFILLVLFCVAGWSVTSRVRQAIAEMSDEELAYIDDELTKTHNYGNAPYWVMYHKYVCAEMKKRGLC